VLWRQVLIVAVLVCALRLPFLNQPIQGDDIYYLAGAQHAQIDPAHPNHARYAFHGEMVSMQGHPHPPLNAWILGGLLFALGDIREIPFHAFYLLLSLTAALSALAIARRFTAHALQATLLFCAVPAFIVNPTSLESDLPLLAFWLLAAALFVHQRYLLAIPALLAAAFAGYQSVVLVPVLAVHLLESRNRQTLPWMLLAVIPAALAGWQLWERATTGAMPAQVLSGFFTTYCLHRLANKISNALALTAHAGWMIFPAAAFYGFRGQAKVPAAAAAVPALAAAWYDPNPLCWASVFAGAFVLVAAVRSAPCRFLAAWIALFFAAALILFFAGSARYLLPLALPLAVAAAPLVPRWAIPANLVLGLLLAVVNYQHWDGYRRFARDMAPEAQSHRVWVNAEWGLRHYLESEGALPLLRGQPVQPGEIVVTSALAFPIPLTTGGGVLAPLRRMTIESPIPLRLIGLESRSAYSTASAGLRPFDFSRSPIDIVTAQTVIPRRPEQSYLNMGDASASSQIVSGVHELENNRWRWAAGRAVILLKSPAVAAPVEVKLYLPDQAPGRRIQITLDGHSIHEQTLAAPGSYTLTTAQQTPTSGDSQLIIEIDKTFQVPNDHRRLGFILASAGFRLPATAP
jgi:hypothetical protein